ncbi:MAG: GNAT family N-acetyltransferase [Candidatus Latescibacteria bacterium]|nr:GNAT family N-acetyltransferase [Candidatus Latescibacterota bacterium]
MQINPGTIDEKPDQIAAEKVLASGQAVSLRPLQADQAAALGAYFTALSPASRRVYGPHPFEQETADDFCAQLDSARTLRLLAWTDVGGGEEVVAYFIVELGVRQGDRQRYDKLGLELDENTDCTLAPSVVDAYQSQGLGSLMMVHLLEVLPRLGRRRLLLWGGVRADNPRAVHFYRKFGFRPVGEFAAGGTNNYDMIVDL